MNPSSIFKAALGTAGNVLAPGASSLFQLGSSLFGQPTPKQTYSSTLQSSVPTSFPSGPQSTLPTSSTGGNTSATTPKQAYVNSQTGSTGSTGTYTSSSDGQTNYAPNTNGGSVVNPNYAYQGLGNTPPGNIDQNSPSYQYQKAFNTYLQSLQPSDAETQAEKNLSAQTLQTQKDQEAALDKPGQTLGFASGEAARVNKNNAFQTDALTNTLNSLTGARTARTNATKAQLDFEQGLYNDSKTAAKPDYTNVSPGSTVFDNKTGKPVYTAPNKATGVSGGSGGAAYAPGTNPIADGWVTAINNNQAKLTDVPAAYKSLVAQGLASAGKDDALKTNALTSAQQLLNSFNNSNGGMLGLLGLGGSKQAVGGSSFLPVIPGTQTADFVANLDNLKSLLSLDNVKYLKGQGAVSDAERKLLADSATQLSRSQSEDAFQKTLQKIIDGLQKFGSPQGGASSADTSNDAEYQSYLQAIGAQ